MRKPATPHERDALTRDRGLLTARPLAWLWRFPLGRRFRARAPREGMALRRHGEEVHDRRRRLPFRLPFPPDKVGGQEFASLRKPLQFLSRNRAGLPISPGVIPSRHDQPPSPARHILDVGSRMVRYDSNVGNFLTGLDPPSHLRFRDSLRVFLKLKLYLVMEFIICFGNNFLDRVSSSDGFCCSWAP